MFQLNNAKLWSSLALLACIACTGLVVVSIMGVRGEWLGIRTAFTYLTYAAQGGIVIAISAAIVFFASGKNYAAKIKSAIGFILVVIPVAIIISHKPAPRGEAPAGIPVNDISTDTANPPQYNAVIPLRPANSNPVEYPGDAVAKRQAELFPDIAPIKTTMNKDAAFNNALSIASHMGWEIVARDSKTGIIEAIATTTFFQFKDDVVIRVTESDESTLVDIRSHSRIGRGDRGKNAERVRDFISQFNTL